MTVSQFCLLNITVTSPWLHSCTAPPTFREKSLQSLWLSQHEPWLTKDKPLTKSKKPGLPISLLTNGKCKSIYKCTAVNCSMVVTLNNPLQVSSLRYSCAQCHPYNSCFAVNHIRNWSHLMQTKPIYIYLKRKKKPVSLFAQSVIHSNSPLHPYTTLVLPLNDYLVKSQLHGYHSF